MIGNSISRKSRLITYIIKSNSRSVFVSSIGMILALVLLSVVIIGSNPVYNGFLRLKLDSISLYVNVGVHSGSLSTEFDYSLLSELNDSIFKNIKDSGLEEYLDRDLPYLQLSSIFSNESQDSERERFILKSTDGTLLEDVFEYSVAGSSLPRNLGEILVENDS
ncbi:MAG: hypothetical protein ACFFD4_19085 [Candidatus Odinarchaeota archaeon]